MKLNIQTQKNFQNNIIYAIYIWQDSQLELRHKTKVVTGQFPSSEKYRGQSIYKLNDFYTDGYSCGLFDITQSEMILKPIKYIYDKERKSNVVYVLCETYSVDTTPTLHNFRSDLRSIINETQHDMFLFGVEQEYYLQKYPRDDLLSKYLDKSVTINNLKHYCNYSGSQQETQQIMKKHLKRCIQFGISIYGTNSECGLQQYEYQLEPLTAIDCSDYLLLSRFLLKEVASEYGYDVIFHPKPFETQPGTGCHVNISTIDWRLQKDEDGFNKLISDTMNNLQANFSLIQLVSGKENYKRLTGQHETGKYETFDYGIGDRSKHCRISNAVNQNRQGYFELRTFGGNINPYIVCIILMNALTKDKMSLYQKPELHTIIQKENIPQFNQILSKFFEFSKTYDQ